MHACETGIGSVLQVYDDLRPVASRKLVKAEVEYGSKASLESDYQAPLLQKRACFKVRLMRLVLLLQSHRCKIARKKHYSY